MLDFTFWGNVFKLTPAVGDNPGVLPVSLRLRPKTSFVACFSLVCQGGAVGGPVPEASQFSWFGRPREELFSEIRRMFC